MEQEAALPSATADSLWAFRSPAPLAEDFPLPGLGQTVRVAGLSRPADRKAIYADQEQFRRIVEDEQGNPKGFRVSHPATGVAYQPDMGDVTAASWCAACVTVSGERLSVLQWLQVAAEIPISGLYARCLVCSRLVPDETEQGDTVTPDGVAAAKEELRADPTSGPGGSSV